MSSSDSIKPPLPSACVPFAAELESVDPAALQSSQNASLLRSPSNKQKIFRKSVPVITPNDITSPSENALQPDEKLIISSQCKSTPPSDSTLSSSQRATLSPQTSYPVVKSTFASSAMDLTSAKVPPKLSSSLARNSSVPVSLFHAPRSPNAQATFSPAIQSRPSLSSPSPPTPIVPSIPLRYATQHSPAHSSTGMLSTPTPHVSPLDRRFPSVKFPVDHSPTAASFATASDPNLASWSFSATPDLNSYSLPLKKLLAKPARPSTFQIESDAEGADPSGRSQRATSSTESVRFTNPDFDTVSIDHEAMISSPSLRGIRDKGGHDNYHYQRTTERINRDDQNEGRKHSSQASADQNGWWSGWRRSEKESKSRGSGKDKIPNPPRNVLKRRPSSSTKVTESRPRSPTQPGRRSLTRSLSASSFLKRAGFLREPSPRGHSPSSMAPNSPSPQPLHSTPHGSPAPPLAADTSKAIEYDAKDNHLVHSHVEHASAQNVHKADGNSNVVPSNGTTTSSIPTDPPTPTGVSKEPSSAFLHSVPASKGLQQISGTRLSTISSVSGSSAGSKSREKALSPAGSIAESFRREQLGSESRNSSPRRTPQTPSPNLQPPAQNSAGKAADVISSSKRSSNSGLSYADTKGLTDNVSSELVVSTSVVVRSSMKQSATSTPSPTFSPRSSMSSPQSPSEPRPRNRLKKARHTSDQIDGFRPYYTVLGAQSERVFSVGGPRDSLGEDWGIRTTITAGRPRTSDGLKERPAFGKSLTRKISGKFKRERSVGPGDGRSGPKVAGEDNEEVRSSGKSPTGKLSGKVQQGQPARESLEKFEEDDANVSFGRPLSRKLSAKRRQNRPSVEVGERPQGRAVPQHGRTVPLSPRTPEDIPADQKRSDDRCLPYFYSHKKQAQSETDIVQRDKSNGTFLRRLFGKSRSKSRDFNIHGIKSDDPPPLPALPKHYASDAHVSPPPRTSSHSSKSSPSTPSAHPSTTTSENAPRFWKRHYSAPSSTSSLEIPPTPTPRTNLKRYATTDDTNRSQTQTQKHDATRSRRAMHVEVEPVYQPAIEVVRSDSPPIPSFSTVDTINSFPARPSSSKNSPTSPTSPHALPQRPNDTRQDSFGDDALYPRVMKPSTRPSPKLTYRELAPRKSDAKLSEKEKADRWVALLEKSDAAGGTLHFGGIDDKLPSDDLRFSRTLSELARDDDD